MINAATICATKRAVDDNSLKSSKAELEHLKIKNETDLTAQETRIIELQNDKDLKCPLSISCMVMTMVLVLLYQLDSKKCFKTYDAQTMTLNYEKFYDNNMERLMREAFLFGAC